MMFAIWGQELSWGKFAGHPVGLKFDTETFHNKYKVFRKSLGEVPVRKKGFLKLPESPVGLGVLGFWGS